jgi:hypothetical protein
MGNKHGLLSDLQLKRWLKDGEPLAKSDGDGLTFTVSSAGCAAWVLRYRYGNRRHELTLGRYPDISLSEVFCPAAPGRRKSRASCSRSRDTTCRGNPRTP